MYKSKVLTLGLALALAGCVTSPPYGSFVKDSLVIDYPIARDAVTKLTALYPPASTRFELKQPTPDTFGRALVNGLREQGYAILEEVAAPASATQPENNSAGAMTPGLPLRYVLDQASDPTQYRLTVLVGNQSLTRPYLAQNGTVVPAGYWTRKE